MKNMRTKNKILKTADKVGKNHQGNYEISISFDLYGEGDDGDGCVADLENRIQNVFQEWVNIIKHSPNDYKIKNIRRNQ